MRILINICISWQLAIQLLTALENGNHMAAQQQLPFSTVSATFVYRHAVPTDIGVVIYLL
jgi:hypothetical protein